MSIVGGKLTTHRLMAEQTVDVVAAKMGVTTPCTTADEILPDQEAGHTYWLGHRLADHEEEGGGDANLLCECELVSRKAVDAYLDRHWPCTIDDVRRGTPRRDGPLPGRVLHVPGRGPARRAPGRAHAATGQPCRALATWTGTAPGHPPSTPPSPTAR